MKKRLFQSIFFIVLSCILLFPYHSVYAASNSLKNITADKNGTVKIELIDPEALKYKITITPNKGYYVDDVRLYYNAKDSITENAASFESGANNAKIWYYDNQKYYEKQNIKVTFGKLNNVGTLQLTAVKDHVAYGEDIRLKIELKDKNGKSTKVTDSGILYLYAPLDLFSFSEIYSKQYYEISRDNTVNIDSTALNGTKELVFSGYYQDRNKGFITGTAEVKVVIDSIKTTIELKDSVQTEGEVFPVKAITSGTGSARVSYEVLRNNSYSWTSRIPQWPGTYKMKAEYSGSNVTKASSASATLTVKENSSPDKYRTKEYLSSNSKDNYIRAAIDGKVLTVEGAGTDTNFRGYNISCGGNSTKVTFEGDRRTFNTVISLDTLQPGAYDIKISPDRISNSGYTHTYTAAKLLLIVGNDEVYFQQSRAYELNKNTFANIDKATGNSYDLSDGKYGGIIDKAKEITAGTKDDYEKMKLLYTWVAESVYYDWDAVFGDSDANKQDPATVFHTGKAVCAGYSNLLHLMLQSVGIKDRQVIGYASSDDYYCTFDSDAGHEWNIAYSTSQNRWIIMDSTWGSLNTSEDGKTQYTPSTLAWFDASLQALSVSHTPSHPKEKTAEVKPEFIDSCTISVGDTISLVKKPVETGYTELSLSPSSILRSGSNLEVKALRAGVCEATIKITVNGKQYNKKITITVKDPEIMKALKTSAAVSLNKEIKESLPSGTAEKYYSFKTNKTAGSYTLQLSNTSKKSDITCIVYDKNGAETGSFDCDPGKNKSLNLSLKKSTTYYVKIYTDAAKPDLKYTMKIKH